MIAPNPSDDSRADCSEDLVPVVYEQLRRLAHHRMAREWPGHTLQATALVHEAYLRVSKDSKAQWENPRHFFGAAACAMRRILVEWARARSGPRRGGDRVRCPLDDFALTCEARSVDLLALDEALDELAERDPRKCDIVSMRFFAGLTIAETADALGVSHATVERDWTFIRAWLRHRLFSEV
jgi:RNA polymerase sigma factor (TIGR02999 family)